MGPRSHAVASSRRPADPGQSRGTCSRRYCPADPPSARAAMARRRFAAPAAWLMGLAVVALAAGAGVSADEVDEVTYTPRAFDGVGNNEANPDWGAVGTAQVCGCVGLG